MALKRYSPVTHVIENAGARLIDDVMFRDEWREQNPEDAKRFEPMAMVFTAENVDAMFDWCRERDMVFSESAEKRIRERIAESGKAEVV